MGAAGFCYVQAELCSPPDQRARATKQRGLARSHRDASLLQSAAREVATEISRCVKQHASCLRQSVCAVQAEPACLGPRRGRAACCLA